MIVVETFAGACVGFALLGLIVGLADRLTHRPAPPTAGGAGLPRRAVPPPPARRAPLRLVERPIQ